MILTVTINPLLERRLYFEKKVIGNSNRSINEEFAAGGKGINVSRQLNILGIKNYAFTFLGGNNGKILRGILNQEKIEFGYVSTKSETRTAEISVIEETKKIKTVLGQNSIISKIEAEEFKRKLEKMIHNCSIVVFSGSSPCEVTDEIFQYGISLAHKYDKISVLDTYGISLIKSLEASPTVIHNNKTEIEKTFSISLSAESDKINFLNTLYAKGIKYSFITDGKNLTYAAKFDFHYKIIPPKINSIDATGSGDSFVAGIVYGLENSLVFEDFTKFATALGSANASTFDTCKATTEQSNALIDKVNIEPIGKKMKLIDDSPTVN